MNSSKNAEEADRKTKAVKKAQEIGLSNRKGAQMTRTLRKRGDDKVAPESAPATMTYAEVAGELQISARTIQRLEVTGKIGPRPVSIGRAIRYRRDEVYQWILAGCPSREEWRGSQV